MAIEQAKVTERSGEDAQTGRQALSNEAFEKKSRPDPEKMEAYADQIEQDFNGGITGWGNDYESVKKLLTKLTKDEYEAVNKIFAEKHGVKYAKKGEAWDIKNELNDELGKEQVDILARIIDSKDENNIPPQYRVDAVEMLKPNSQLNLGETNRMTLPSGRTYDVFVPKEMDTRAPVVIAMHGTGFGEGLNVMEQETGFNIDATREGAIVVYASPKPVDHELLGSLDATGVSWNVPNRLNLHSDSYAHDDRIYIDNIRKHLADQINTSKQIAMVGFSGGALFAQHYNDARPGVVAAITSMHGTAMLGDRLPKVPVPINIIHSQADKTLRYDGGPGSIGTLMSTALNTNLSLSRPRLQFEQWADLNGCKYSDMDLEVAQDHIKLSFGNCSKAPVTETIYANNGHAIHDESNDGPRLLQRFLGAPNRSLNLASEQFKFGVKHVLAKADASSAYKSFLLDQK